MQTPCQHRSFTYVVVTSTAGHVAVASPTVGVPRPTDNLLGEKSADVNADTAMATTLEVAAVLTQCPQLTKLSIDCACYDVVPRVAVTVLTLPTDLQSTPSVTKGDRTYAVRLSGALGWSRSTSEVRASTAPARTSTC